MIDSALSNLQKAKLEFTKRIKAFSDKSQHDNLNTYRNLVHGNIESSLLVSFPRVHALLDTNSWSYLLKGFTADYELTNLSYKEIAAKFVLYLESMKDLPCDYAFLPSLADYEYAEVMVDLAEDDDFTYIDEFGDILNAKPYITNACYMGVYNYPVHEICAEVIPTDPLETPICLLLYRNRNDQVKFFKLNSLSAALVESLQLNEAVSGGEAIERLAMSTGNKHDSVFLKTGMDTLRKFYDSGLVLGVWHRFHG